MKQVTYRDYAEALNKLNFEINKMSENGSKCWSSLGTLYNINSVFGDKPIKLGINWCACGTVELERAEMYAKEIPKVIKLAKNFKYNGYVVVFD